MRRRPRQKQGRHNQDLQKLKFNFTSCLSNKDRGQECEDRVIDYFCEQKWLLLARNLKLWLTEVDLLFLSAEGGLVLVEVKSAIESAMGFRPLISQSQRDRLLRVTQHLQAASPLGVRAHIAAVSHDKEVILYMDFLSASKG